MALDLKRTREIRQLMLVAERYLALAESAKDELDRRLSDTAAEFAPGAAPSPETRRLTFIAADLSSAAIRLATVDQVLCRAGAVRSGYNECVVYYSREEFNPSLTRPAYSQWLHVMLRDSIGHNEPPETRVTPRGERQDMIERLSFAHAYEVLKAIAAKLGAHLEDKHHIELLPTIELNG